MSNHEKGVFTGRNTSNFYQLGDTIHRNLRGKSYTIHKLLNHLEYKSFNYVPSFLGINHKGREITSYVKDDLMKTY